MAISNNRSAFSLEKRYDGVKLDATMISDLGLLTTNSTIGELRELMSRLIGDYLVTAVNSTGKATSVLTSLAPTDIALSAAALAASTAGDVTPVTIGTLSVTQPLSQPITYTLVAGTGSTDNAKYSISGSSLRYISTGEVAGSNTVRIRATTIGGHTYEEAFTITVS